MIKTLTKHGNSLALILDRPILQLLKIDAKTPLQITTDGRNLLISPADSLRKRRIAAAYEAVNNRYGHALKRLAK